MTDSLKTLEAAHRILAERRRTTRVSKNASPSAASLLRILNFTSSSNAIKNPSAQNLNPS